MEYFTRQMQLIGTSPQFSFHPNCSSLNLNHLMFADNVLIFSKAYLPTLKMIMQVLTDFHVCSGLKANIAKSQVIFGGCDTDLQTDCLHITQFQEGSFPLRYLGVPITASKLSKNECRVLVEKIMGKVQLWSSRSFSFAGQAQLLNLWFSVCSPTGPLCS